MDDMDRLLGQNRIFVDRLQGVGVLTKEEAINRSCTGPIARASGVVRDLRRDEPYLSYADFDFDVCCAREGDCLARFQVRVAEMVGEPENHRAGRGKHSRRAAQRGPGPPFDPAAAGPGLDDDRGPDLALRIGHAQPRPAGAQ